MLLPNGCLRDEEPILTDSLQISSLTVPVYRYRCQSVN